MRFATVVAMFAALSTFAMGAAIDERDVCGSGVPPSSVRLQGNSSVLRPLLQVGKEWRSCLPEPRLREVVWLQLESRGRM
ncbi:hypothetical protein OPQ81_005338 [Rhizoctonia solani]|nr:hypothetical protein OPQ81_005338 [Rhizoctonia solani]